MSGGEARALTAAFTLLACARAVPPTGGPYTESSVDGGCEDGSDNDHDGVSDCEDVDCARAPACARDSGPGDDTGVAPILTPTIEATWSETGVSVQIEGGEIRYLLGMVETDPSSADPWSGEDCLMGYVSPSGTISLYCHPMSSTGVSLRTVAEIDQIVEGETTLLDLSRADHITYAAFTEDNRACWTWGSEPGYYDSAGCDPL